MLKVDCDGKKRCRGSVTDRATRTGSYGERGGGILPIYNPAGNNERSGPKKKKKQPGAVNAELLTLTIYIKGIRLVSNLNLQTQWELNPLAYQIQKNNTIKIV